MSSAPTDNVSSSEKYSQLLDEAKAIRGVSLGRDAWRRLCKSRTAIASLAYLVILSLAAFFTPLLPLQSPIEQGLGSRQFQPPSNATVSLDIQDDLKQFQHEIAVLNQQLQQSTSNEATKLRRQITDKQRHDHPVVQLWSNPGIIDRWLLQTRLTIFGDYCIPSICGTDNLGRDLLARLFWGARISLIVGVVATLVSLAIGVSYGALAGYLGGWVDDLMMRLVDVLYSVPFIFVVIFLITILNEESIKTQLEEYGINQIVIFYIVIGAIYWLTMARVVRGQVISLKNEQFVEAARTIGASTPRIVFRHLIPNVLSVVIVYLTLTIPRVMLFEAFLSFLGLGVTPPDVSWGLLANEGIQVITPLKIYWWLIVFPGLALGGTLFALNFLGDGLRDALDPRMKNR